MGLGLGLGAQRGGGARLDPATVAYFAAMNQDSKSENIPIISMVDTFVKSLKNANIYDAFDAIWLYATNDTSGAIQANDMCLVNLINPEMIGTPVNSPYLVKLSGIQGSENLGTTGGYIKSGYSPDGVTSKQKALTQGTGVYFHSGGSADFSEIGKMDSTTIGTYVGSLYSSNLNIRTTSLYGILANTSRKAIKAAYRRNSETMQIAVSGKTKSLPLSASVGTFVQRQYFILARNNFGSLGAESAGLFSNKRISMAFAGRDLSDAEHDAFVDIFDAYLTAIGAS